MTSQLATLRVLCPITIIISVISMITGILQLVFVSPDHGWPQSSGAGIWSGIIVMVASIMGILASKKSDDPEDCTLKKLHSAHFGLSIAALSCCIQDLVYSSQMLANCSNATLAADTDYCSTKVEGTVAVAAANVVLAFIMILNCIAFVSMYYCHRKQVGCSGKICGSEKY